jgi:hypothetical protein
MMERMYGGDACMIAAWLLASRRRAQLVGNYGMDAHYFTEPFLSANIKSPYAGIYGPITARNPV